MTILDYFPGEPRPVQVQALERIEALWNEADVFVVGLSVGSGKSRVAKCIADWQTAKKKKATILTPTNILVQQYKKDFPDLWSLEKKSAHKCTGLTQHSNFSCADYHQLERRHCQGCPYIRNIMIAKKASKGVYNYYTYMAHRLFNETVIIDEAHNTIQVMKDAAAKKLWKSQHHFGPEVRTYGSLLTWVRNRRKQVPGNKTLIKLEEDLEQNARKYVISRGLEYYRGSEQECIKMTPVDVSDEAPLLWPSKVKKLVLMSATFSYKDIKELGLDGKRVAYIDLPSPIPAGHRPVIFIPHCSMAYKAQEQNIPKLVEAVRLLALTHKSKGLIHATYGLAYKLRQQLKHDPRFMFHDNENKLQVYQQFRDTKEPRILVASGLYEGVDLAGNDYTWQVITKVPFPSLAEPAIQHKAEVDKLWYTWEALKVVFQACGRICRGPEDYGKTIILDTTWRRLYNEAKESKLIPGWWEEGYAEYSNLDQANV